MEEIMNAPSISNLKKIRHEKGMTASELSKKTGIRLMRIQHYESKYRDINKAEALVVYKLALGLGCDVSEILELPEDICQVKNSTKTQKKRRKEITSEE